MKILITGGSGLVGSHLTRLLVQQGHQVQHVSRKKYTHPQAQVFEWDPVNMKIESGALEGVDAVVNLAGAGVADKRWTPSRKRTLLESRTKSLQCLYKLVSKMNIRPRALISASGIGFYGRQPIDKI